MFSKRWFVVESSRYPLDALNELHRKRCYMACSEVIDDGGYKRFDIRTWNQRQLVSTHRLFMTEEDARRDFLEQTERARGIASNFHDLRISRKIKDTDCPYFRLWSIDARTKNGVAAIFHKGKTRELCEDTGLPLIPEMVETRTF